MLTVYVVKVPTKDSFYSELAFGFDLELKGSTSRALIIQDHKLFDALPDEARIYMREEGVNEEGWYQEVIVDCPLTIKELRQLRKEYINLTR